MNLTLNGSHITSECFEYLNTLKLKTLDISNCHDVDTLEGLNIPSMTEFYMHGVWLKDDDIKFIFKNSLLKVLDFSYCSYVTNRTLQHIHDHKLKLDILKLR